MPEDENNVDFSRFLIERIKERGLNLRKLSELTGVSLKHLEALVKANLENLPATPYVRGYLEQLGRVLGFDYEDWWQKIKNTRRLKDSGADDQLPKNRFIGRSPSKLILAAAAAAIIVLYLGLHFGRILGRPSVTVNYPPGNLLNSSTSKITFLGTAQGADELYVNGDSVTMAADGSWSKTVLLQPGINAVEIDAKKFLGGETKILEQIIYEPATSSVGGFGPNP